MSRAIVAVAVLSMAMSWASEAAAEKPAALSEATSAKFVDTPLNDAMRSLAKQHKIEIRVDEASLTDIGIALDEPMNLKVEGVTLESLLAELLLPLGLTTVILQDGAVEVTTFEIADERVETRRYDLSPITGVYAVDGKQFLDSIYDATDGQWKVLDGIGGKASIEGNTLTVEQVARVHDQIERLLAQITRIVNPEQGPPLTATEKKELAIRERLSLPVTLQWEDVTLADAMGKVGKLIDAMVLVDEVALVKLSVDAEQPVTINTNDQPLEDVLDSTLEPLKLTWVIEDEVVKITSQETAAEKITFRTYDLREKIRTPEEARKLAARLQKAGIGQWEAIDGIGGSISFIGGLMIVRQQRSIQEQIAKILKAQ